LQIFKNTLFEANLKSVNIIEKAIFLNELFQAYSITESIRCTFVSGILVGLTNQAYRSSFKLCSTAIEITESTIAAIKSAFSSASGSKREVMIAEYSKLLNEPIVKQDRIKHRDRQERENTADVLKEIVGYLDKYIFPLTQMDSGGYDVLGRFYTEFIRYAGSEQSQGLVLTPFHITDLFVDLAEVTENSVVYDPCTGSAGFLISAMKRMIGYAGNDQQKTVNIKSAKLIGVELRPSMFTYACSNMMLRGDGRSNIYRDDCFIIKDTIISEHHPTVAFLNPPYDVGTAGQMRFVEHALDVVSGSDGLVVAIVQMSCFVKNEKELRAVKESILGKARLIAVLSMPHDLFYPVPVDTAVVVLKAGIPNGSHKTWFGYVKNDGFVKVKHQGRVDAKGQWESIRSRLLDAYHQKKEIPGFSLLANVAAEDEWCAEANLKTNYDVLDAGFFETKLKEYFTFLVKNCLNETLGTALGGTVNNESLELDIENWKEFRYSDVFRIEKGYYNKKPEAGPSLKGYYFVGASDSNNGITSWHSEDEIKSVSKTGSEDDTIDGKLFKGNCITVSNNGSVGCAFYQPIPFTCSHDVNPIYLISRDLNQYLGLFICAVIELEKFRWAYGRKWRPVRMPSSVIKLPVDERGDPDFQFMEDYIKSLPFSLNI